MDVLAQVFPGIATLFVEDPILGVVRVGLTILGFVLAYFGFKGKLEPLIMVPMGLGMIAVNCGVLFLAGDTTGTLIIDPLVSDTDSLMTAIQVNFLQPIYNFMFSNNLIACLVFMGIGARSEISFLLSRPWTCIIIAIFAEMGTFVTLALGVDFFGLDPASAASVAIIGGADGPTAILVALKMAPELLGAIAVCAYSYMALIPIIQPPIMRLLTTEKERAIRMDPPRQVSKNEKILFPIVSAIVTVILLPSAAWLIGMLMMGNLLRESGVTGRLSETAQNALINIVTILLGLSVGASARADLFLKKETLFILVLGIVAFAGGTAGGILFAKIMNLFSKKKINPLIGAAGVSAVPMAARVAHKEGQRADPNNYLLMHAMGPNVAGVIGSAVAAGVLLGFLS